MTWRFLPENFDHLTSEKHGFNKGDGGNHNEVFGKESNFKLQVLWNTSVHIF